MKGNKTHGKNHVEMETIKIGELSLIKALKISLKFNNCHFTQKGDHIDL